MKGVSKNYPAKNCGVHCNLTHDKTYFILYFFWCLYLCTGLIIVVESLASFALAADEEVLVFVSKFELAGICCISSVVLFWVGVEHAMARVHTNTKLINAFPMTLHLCIQSEIVFENIFYR